VILGVPLILPDSSRHHCKHTAVPEIWLPALQNRFIFRNRSHFLFVKESIVEYCVLQDKWLPTAGWRQDHHGDYATYELARGGTVGVSEILAQIDREIAQLQRARALLGGGAPAAKKKAAPPAAKKVVKKKKRNLTPEGRKRIAEAVRRRWAEQKKASASK
jgi:hypothetical protein